MDKLERIKAEIERLKEKSKSVEMDTEYTLAWLLDFINSLQEEPVSGDLEEAAEAEADKMLEVVDPELASAKYLRHTKMRVRTFDGTDIEDAFKDGAEWQKEQFEKNRLAACDAQTPEEAEREMDFVEHIIKEEHRHPTYSDAIEYGMKKMKQQMMKDVIDAVIHPYDGEIWVDKKDLEKYDEDQKVKLIIMKEEQV